jgi:ABC transporter transmembrane region
MRTVSALTLERQRFRDYETALGAAEPKYILAAFTGGFTAGMSMFIQQWINALQMWFGGYLLSNYSHLYGFKDFLIANFAVLFALFGLGSAFQDISDRKEVVKSAGRIFYLMDRQSEIDPLSKSGIIPQANHSNGKGVNNDFVPQQSTVPAALEETIVFEESYHRRVPLWPEPFENPGRARLDV